MNAPFINALKENALEAVIRLKDETRLFFQDAEGLFNKGEGHEEILQKGGKAVEVWDFSGFEIEKSPHKLRVVRYRESWEEKRNVQWWMWLATTMEQADHRILWEMMKRRWDIEENVFLQLKTYYYTKHCYCHMAAEAVFALTIIGFNMREPYLYRRNRSFRCSNISRKSVIRIFCDELLIENMKGILYKKGG